MSGSEPRLYRAQQIVARQRQLAFRRNGQPCISMSILSNLETSIALLEQPKHLNKTSNTPATTTRSRARARYLQNMQELTRLMNILREGGYCVEFPQELLC